MSVVLSEHLPLLASAPNGIQKLRGLILELAVRGKLVQQDAKDEPASELLKRIAKERARLEAEGAIKKTKLLPAVSENEQPFVVPTNWEWSRLGQLAMMVTDGTHHTPTYLPAGIPFISVKDIDGSTVSFADCRYISEAEHKQINQRCNPERGDILLCRIGTLGRPTVVDTDRPFSLFVSVGLIKLPKFFGLSRYLHLVLLSPCLTTQYDQIKAGGSHTNKLNLGDIPTLCIPVPPLAEQHRIVAKVDELMALCDRLEQEVGAGETAHAKLVDTLLGTLTQSTDADDLAANWQRLAEHFDILFTTESSLDTLKQVILQLAVMGKLVPQDSNDEPASKLLTHIAKERALLEAEGASKQSKPLPPVGEDEQPFDVPPLWAWVRLSDVTTKITDGTHHSPPNLSAGDFKYISAKNIKRWGIDQSGMTFVTKEIHKEIYSRCNPDRGDILYIKDGATTGIAAINTLDEPFSMLSSVALLKPSIGLFNRYLYFLMSSPLFYDEMRAGMTGVAITRVTLAKLNVALLPLPPLAEQHRIVAKVDELMALCDRLKADLAESRTRQARLSATLIESALQAA